MDGSINGDKQTKPDRLTQKVWTDGQINRKAYRFRQRRQVR